MKIKIRNLPKCFWGSSMPKFTTMLLLIFQEEQVNSAIQQNQQEISSNRSTKSHFKAERLLQTFSALSSAYTILCAVQPSSTVNLWNKVVFHLDQRCWFGLLFLRAKVHHITQRGAPIPSSCFYPENMTNPLWNVSHVLAQYRTIFHLCTYVV